MVQQIDFLTSSIDLSEDEHQSAAGGHGADGSACSVLTAGGCLQRPLELGNKPRAADSSSRRDDHCRSVSPPNVLLNALTAGFSPDGSRLRWAPRAAPLRQDSSLRSSSPPQLEDHADISASPQKTLAVRPPTPGLSPLTVNLHHPSSPGSPPDSPGPSTSITVSPSSSPLSPKIKPPPTLCPSVIIENKIRYYQNPQSDHPSVGPPSWIQPPSACCPPTNMETHISASDHKEEPSSSAPPVNRLSYRRTGSVSATTAKPLTAQGRRGRKPPPYPHHRLSEQAKKEEPRKAPPYPEKRRLLSTTV